jgi:N-acetylneuraminic acid mutarotase
MKKISTILLFLIAATAMGQVVKKANVSGNRDAAVCFTIGDKLYMGGGAGKKDFYEYTPSTDTWVQKEDIPGVTESRAFGVGVAINGKGYVGLGGDNDNTTLKKDWWEYDPTNDTWTQKADFIGVARDGSAFFVVNNKAYIVGGTDNRFVYGDVYEYNPTNDTWIQMAANYPQGPIIFGTGFSIGNYGYITCGAAQAEYTATYQFDPQSYTWKRMADFTGTPRQTAIGFSVNNMGYVGGGQQSYSQAFKDFYSFNPASNTWKLVGDIGDKGRAWGCASVVNGKAYLGTGWDFGASFLNDWWEFTPQQSTASVKNTSATAPVIYSDIENSTLQIRFTSETPRTLNIIDVSGKLLSTQTTNNSMATINTTLLSAGIYILETNTNNTSNRQKFIIR